MVCGDEGAGFKIIKFWGVLDLRCRRFRRGCLSFESFRTQGFGVSAFQGLVWVLRI